MATQKSRSKPRTVTPVAILGGNRIPFAKSNGAYAHASNADMLTSALDGLVARFGLAGARLDEVVAGAVLKHSRDFNLTRECVLGSRLSPQTPAFDVQRACGTSLEATIAVANKIALGQIDSGVAGGVDTTSDAPLAVHEDLRQLLLDANRARSFGGRVKAFARMRPWHAMPEIPRNAEPRTGLSMGEHAARTALHWDISRADQDALAVNSHQRLAAAYDRGFFDDLVTGYLGLTRDGLLRADTSVEKLAKLAPAFGSGEQATMTAGNSSPLTDGAATVLLSSPEWASEHSLPVLAHLVDCQSAAVDFVSGDEGLLTAPVYAVPKLLRRNGLSLSDFDFYEIHEAFASQVLATLAAWRDPEFCAERLGLDEPLGEIDDKRLNVAGSSLATGHPFAATGARIVATAAKLLAEKGSGRALISICAAGGQGVTAILER
ncbi:acetyl-CoA C-acetyltransferase [Stackebrandtia nassauensis]|uniref:Acetyl-CoA acetyltransferase n=1 Tax=Stackebrandtia nassauensis (strain DSM 44728 / CIP 108903 / NRRL B-16338 / NBRC 102104 / LLR-40K-21) TaxID=446470 RepID=D3QAA7_STANL|nr:acetyl-CoA C-acetyltransferase [Stackebrandtia nassauensis]ADD42690.1 acetyl-CoA acetyltransferase [Stackebrandtia nassauensis DSM 44728]